jgi:hypothetical protein
MWLEEPLRNLYQASRKRARLAAATPKNPLST